MTQWLEELADSLVDEQHRAQLRPPEGLGDAVVAVVTEISFAPPGVKLPMLVYDRGMLLDILAQREREKDGYSAEDEEDNMDYVRAEQQMYLESNWGGQQFALSEGKSNIL